jgi:TPR repeat protein
LQLVFPIVLEAVKWLCRAADQGYVQAQYNLGFMHQIGEGIPQDSIEACKRYSLAAAQGIGMASEKRKDLAAHMTPGQIAESQRRFSAFSARKGS